MCLPRAAFAVSEEMAAPAAAVLSPVARDYPSRAFDEYFSPSRSRLFYQGTRWKLKFPCGKEKCFLFTTFTPAKSVNNLGTI